MSLTATQLATKRHERTMSSRSRRITKLRRLENDQREGRNRASWLADLGKTHQDAAKAMEDRHRQALESRRTKAAMPRHTPKGIIGRIQSFFRRTP
jgi:hypothetical protein